MEEFATAERALGASAGQVAVAWWQEWVQIQADLTWLYYWDNRVEQMAQLVAVGTARRGARRHAQAARRVLQRAAT